MVSKQIPQHRIEHSTKIGYKFKFQLSYGREHWTKHYCLETIASVNKMQLRNTNVCQFQHGTDFVSISDVLAN